MLMSAALSTNRVNGFSFRNPVTKYLLPRNLVAALILSGAPDAEGDGVGASVDGEFGDADLSTRSTESKNWNGVIPL